MKSTETKYFCDNCGRKLNTCQNTMDIVTSKKETNPRSRLHVKIENAHGCHNDSTTEDAELCQACAIRLLSNAVNRIRKGERATAGTQSSDEEVWK